MNKQTLDKQTLDKQILAKQAVEAGKQLKTALQAVEACLLANAQVVYEDAKANYSTPSYLGHTEEQLVCRAWGVLRTSFGSLSMYPSEATIEELAKLLAARAIDAFADKDVYLRAANEIRRVDETRR